MIANPEDLIHGREGAAVTDTHGRGHGRRDVPHQAADRHKAVFRQSVPKGGN